VSSTFKATPLHFARQPILDRQQRLIGYEVLYRSLHAGMTAADAPDVATATVSVHAVLDIGLDAMAGSAQVFFNMTRQSLAQGLYEFLPAKRVVLEVSGDIAVDPELARDIERARVQGYKIALDDSLLSAGVADLIPLADVIKVQVLELDQAGITRRARELARPGVLLLAEKVETHAMHRACLDAGYHLFQGYFFARPEIVKGMHVPPDRALLLRLLAEVQSPAATIDSIERLVVANAALGYKLLRYVNSALYGVTQPIQSIRHAIMMLGLDRVQTCACMLLLAGIDSKPQPLLMTALMRAKLCQLVGQIRTRENPQTLFTVGLLSLMDSFLDRPMEELLDHLPVAPELHAALLYRRGPLAPALESAIAFERRDEAHLSAAGLEPKQWNACYLDALKWTRELCQFLDR
jgi:EAL and modified HD-GYP domain-containing signal transduction protein